jgi:RNA polymerase sigma-70 factor (ECF subfamily)
MAADVVFAAWEAGRAAWPAVALERERFAAHVGSLDPAAVERHPADLYLAAACLAGDREAIEIFDRDLFASSRGAIRSIGKEDNFVEEVWQRVRAHLFVGDDGRPRLADYAGRGPLRAWVGIVAARTGLMMRRSQQRAKEVSLDTDDWTEALAMISTGNPELELFKRQYASAFLDALREAIGGIDARLRATLRLSFVDALSAEEIGAVYGVHRATAGRWIQHACEEVFARTRQALAKKLALSSTELDRMTALVRSQLDVSLSVLLPANLEP